MYNPCQRKELIKMAKTKPVVETTTTKKGGTVSEEYAITQIMLSYNDLQRFFKDNNKKYNFINKNQMNEFKSKHLREEEIAYAKEFYEWLKFIHKRINRFLYTENVLNSIYGREDVNIMELTPEEREYINKRRARQANKKSELV